MRVPFGSPFTPFFLGAPTKGPDLLARRKGSLGIAVPAIEKGVGTLLFRSATLLGGTPAPASAIHQMPRNHGQRGPRGRGPSRPTLDFAPFGSFQQVFRKSNQSFSVTAVELRHALVCRWRLDEAQRAEPGGVESQTLTETMADLFSL